MGYFRKKRFSLGEVVGLLAIAFIGLAIIGYAASVTVPNTFSPGTTISSTEVNDNFTALKDGIDENKSAAACSPEVLSTNLSTTVTDIVSVTITVPGPGRVMVSGSGTFSLNNDGSEWEGDVWITGTGGGTTGDFRNFWRGPSNLPIGTYATPFHEQAIFEESAGGTITYYLTGRHFGTQPINALRASICAVFAPN